MKVTTFGKITASVGVAAVIASAIAGPAFADPGAGSFGTLVGVGSDTTQDVASAIANQSGGAIASYNAAGAGLSSSIATRPGDATTIPRVSGSGAGVNTLLVAIGALANKTGVAVSDGSTTTITPAVSGYVDFARSSSGVTTTSGVVTYIPFAKDAVSIAVAPLDAAKVANVPITVGSKDDAANAPSLFRLYHGDVRYFYFTTGTDNYVGAGKTAGEAPVGSTAYLVEPLLPKFGSGTRSYFLGKIALTDAANFTTVTPGTGDYGVKDTSGGVPIEEHDGTAVVAETSGTTIAISPFSIGQWVAQGNGLVNDRRHGAVLTKVGGQAATTGSAGSYATNTSYSQLVRDVFNVVPSKLADDPSSAVAKAFVGANSTFCQATSTITAYGFLPEPAGQCGTTTLRAIDPSASSVAVAVPATATVNTAATATATIASNGNGGGSVIFKSGATTIATVAVAKNATTASTSIPTNVVGGGTITAQFVPALSGVASSISPAAAYTVTATATVTKHTPKITIAKIKSVKLSKKGKVVVTVKYSKTKATGTVTIKEGKKTLASKKKLKKGKVTITLPKFKKTGTHKLTVIYNGSSTLKTVKKTAVKIKVIR